MADGPPVRKERHTSVASVVQNRCSVHKLSIDVVLDLQSELRGCDFRLSLSWSCDRSDPKSHTRRGTLKGTFDILSGIDHGVDARCQLRQGSWH